MPPLNPKDVVIYLNSVFDLDSINWAQQMRLAKSLLSKYNYNEIKYAIDYYKNRGDVLSSLGFLTYKMNMKDPVSLYHAEANVTGDDNSGNRNRERIRKNSQTYNRAEYPIALFEESNEAD